MAINPKKKKLFRHITAYLRSIGKINKFTANKHKDLLKLFIEITNIEIDWSISNNDARLTKLLLSDGFKPYLQYKPLSKKKKRERKDEYESYLQSKEWRNKREEAFVFYGKQCVNCNSIRLLQVHHKTYKNIFKEPMSDLMVLCRHCHKMAHRTRDSKFFIE